MARLVTAVLMVLFALTPFTIASAQSAWVKEVRTGKAGSTPDKICKDLHQFYKMAQPNRGLGIDIAKNLLVEFRIPQFIKLSRGESCGEKGRYFLYIPDGTTIMDTLISVLVRAGASPQDIGSTPAALRRTLREDLTAHFAEVRRVYQEGKASRSDYYEPLLIDVARRAVNEWGFTPLELGLTSDEVAMLRQR